MESRRTFLKSIGTVGAIGVTAGCTGGGDGGGGTTESGGDGGGGTTESGGDGGMEATETEASTATPEPYGNGEVDFNVSPSVAQEDLEQQYAPIQEHLSEALGVPANLNLANNYSAVIQALGSGTADVAETGPFAAALGVNADMANIVLMRRGYGSWTYGSIIATTPDSDISSLSDLEGKTVAFADRLSTSGSLYPIHNIMTEGGLDVGSLPQGSGSDADFEPVFAGSHSASFETLINGQADAAGMGRFIRETVRPDDFSAEATTVFEEGGLPRAPIVTSPQLTDENEQAIVDAFTDAPDSIYYGADGEPDTDDDLWFNAVREASVDDYQSVIEVANDLDVGTDIFEG